MLSKPNYGWTTVTLGNVKMPASYTTDIPTDMLKGFMEHLKHKKDTCIRIDGEGEGEFIIVLTDCVIYIISDDDSLKVVEECPKYLIDELIRDIKIHLDSWCKWPPECDIELMTAKQYAKYVNKRKRQIKSLIKEISQIQLDTA